MTVRFRLAVVASLVAALVLFVAGVLLMVAAMSPSTCIWIAGIGGCLVPG